MCGADSQDRREDCIDRLTSDERGDKLDYIFTVDIFNGDVDIPEINQVIMLRATESPIVYIQQLGRGLRKSEGKEYVVILDFIGNYMNNFMIPVALSGDRSYNKDNMRKYVFSATRMVPGSSSIHFDEISRKRIFASIDSAKTNDMKLIRESYQNLKYKMGRIPKANIRLQSIFADFLRIRYLLNCFLNWSILEWYSIKRIILTDTRTRIFSYIRNIPTRMYAVF